MVGGSQLCYIVTLTNESESLTFRNTSGNEGIVVEVCAGGQYGNFPEIFCANFEKAKNIIVLFFQGKEMQETWV